MKLGSKENKQAIPECAVCGKQFPRGLLDLNRHVNATTLQHLFAERASSSYPYGCNRCGLHFTKEEHLTCHNQFSSCGLGGVGNSAVVGEQDKADAGSSSDDIQVIGSPLAQILKTGESFAPETGEGNRTLECMVCGKLFPRGPVDLQRHATAITLKHLVSSKRSSAFPNGCNRCGLWFTTEEHLKSHESNSTCNSDMVWPENAHSTAGLRAISCAEFSRQRAQAQTMLSPKPTASIQSTTKAIDPLSASNKPRNKLEVSPLENANISPLNTRKRIIRTNRYLEESSPSAAVNNSNETDEPLVKPKFDAKDSDDSKKRLYAAIQEDLSHARQKRATVIVPEERQAFFAIVSLLVEPKSIPVDKKVTEENYEEFISEEHKPLLNKLKNCLLYV